MTVPSRSRKLNSQGVKNDVAAQGGNPVEVKESFMLAALSIRFPLPKASVEELVNGDRRDVDASLISKELQELLEDPQSIECF